MWRVGLCMERGKACWVRMGSGELGLSLERIGKVYFGYLERKSVFFKALRSALSVLRFSNSQ